MSEPAIAGGGMATNVNPYGQGPSEDEESMDFESMSESMEADDAVSNDEDVYNDAETEAYDEDDVDEDEENDDDEGYF